MNDNSIGKVIFSSPQSIWVEINDSKIFELNKKNLQVGKYLSISDGNLNKVVCSIQNIKAKESSNYTDEYEYGKFIIETQPIGTIEGEAFKRGSNSLPIPLEDVFILDEEFLKIIFSQSETYNFEFGNLLQNDKVNLYIDGNKFFGKHIAVVGSTGSGKSCTVSKILQSSVGISEQANINNGEQKNSHIIIFDIHSEYKKAFELEDNQNFSLNYLDMASLKLPYWLMNSEELEDLLIESNEGVSHNQISILRKAIILNKEKHNPGVDKIDYDTPVYFNLKEVYNYINNSNIATKDASTSELKIQNKINNLGRDEYQLFEENVIFASKERGKVNDGPFAGEFDRFVIRLNTLLNDKRLKFITEPLKENGDDYKTDDFEFILKQFIGYLDKSNITIIDLSGIPFEVLSITVSLISRIVFDFCFHYSKIKNKIKELNDNPILIVFEEAHNYIPRSNDSSYKSVKKSVERIAKEGRKYGLSSMIVSQRPSEISETILSQCSNFVALRLTNPNDQNFIRKLLPDGVASISDILPSLSKGQCLIVGDAVPIPSLVQLSMPNPSPSSDDIPVIDEWSSLWKDINFSDVIRRWKKQ